MKRNLLGLITAIVVASPVGAAPQKSSGGLKIPPAPNVASPIPSIVPSTTAAAPAAPSNEVRLGGGSYQVSNPSAQQRFADYFDVKQAGNPLTLTMTHGNPRFTWLRVAIAGRQVATEKTFATGGTQKVDVTDVVAAGTSQLQVEGAGPAGAKFTWQISTTKSAIKVTSLDPNDEVVVGDKVKIAGEGFPANPAAVQVNFNAKRARINSATPRQLQVEVPQDADTGDNNVTVKVGGWTSDPKKLKVRGIPELSGTNLQGVAPGMELIIYGKNFSEKAGENQVLFNDQVSASVTAATKTQLTVQTPNVGYIPGGASTTVADGASVSTISLKVGKVKSKNTLSVKVGPFMYKDNPFDTSADTPRAGDPRYTQGNPLGN
jgi:hypothetical protein